MEMAEMKNGKEDTVMKKMNSIRIAAALLMGAATFSACEVTFTVPEEEAIPCVLTVEATKGEDDATKALEDAGTTITATWEVNDEVQVYNSSDVKLGTIRATTAGASTTLTGTLDSTPVLGDVLTLKFKSPSYADQEGTLDFIASNCDYATATVTVVAADKGYGTAVTTKASFVNQQAIVKFTLKNKSGSANLPVTSLTISDGTNSYIVTPASATNVLYVALPGFSGRTMTLTADTEKYGLVRTGVTFENGKYYTRTVKMLPYFTVGAGKHVLFSPGNLQATYNGSSWSWAFAANQWDYIGNVAGNTSIDGNGTVSSSNVTVDLFGWVGASSNWTGAAQYGISNSTTTGSADTYGNVKDEGLKSDWGNTISDGYTWRTLTHEEWRYMLLTRSMSIERRSTLGQKVNNKLGIVIYPDNYAGELYVGSDWPAFEAAGCVFLPAAGRRYGTSVAVDNEQGYYWVSTSDESDAAKAHYEYFTSSGSFFTYTNSRCWGYSVRLILEL